ncbi:phosphatase PAP2/dual specificity phosphatase family protein [Ottowia sp.]|uniref:phosphatase PAP2/dual specificity phosphatase family protein n=1 Tax=Ottowia sp. TaxID=1898956 RepID=UPI003A855A2B
MKPCAPGAWPWRLAAAWLALLGPLFYLTYGLANWWAGRQWAAGHVPSVVFDWERHIPFWDWTIFPYWSINVFYGLSLFLSCSTHRINRHAARLLTAQAVAVTCFVLWPLHFSFGQPEAHGAAAWLFNALRGFDQPFNQAPSLHIALAVILWDWYRQLWTKPWQRVVLHVWTLAICASVLTTYQHHFIDIPTGALLGVACVWLWPLERAASLPAAWRLSRDRQRRKLALFYGLGALACWALGLMGGGWALWLCWPAASLAVVALNYLGFGARGFRMDGTGRMHWSTRWLLAPYQWGAALNAWAWTRRLPAKVQVAPGLWLGRRPSSAEWLAAGQPAVFSLCAELPLPAAVQPGSRCLPWLDLVAADAPALRRAAQHIQALRQTSSSGVWVCCALGFSRSAAAVAAWQLRYGQAASAEQALALVRAARPQLVLGPLWMQGLRVLKPPPIFKNDEQHP